MLIVLAKILIVSLVILSAGIGQNYNEAKMKKDTEGMNSYSTLMTLQIAVIILLLFLI